MTGSARLLLVEDDEVLRTSLAASLRAAGFVVSALAHGSELEQHLGTQRPDLVLLDWMLPGRDGPELAQVVRRRSGAAVVMLTAREGVADRIRAFDLGADDYVPKPFATEELIARIRAVLRRLGRLPTVVEVDDLVVDEEAGLVTRGGQEIAMTATELRLLGYLARHRDRVLSTTQILSQVWGYDEYADNLVQVHVSALRRKIEAHGPRLIHTRRGLGYVLQAPSS
ncbi:response regulator transcription factor [Nocardioides acrostichi]|uniref:Response regulator transcription factor n=1 Tax=Nocardioides acrostichi TaxID=2784339 RepID=A0A930UV91_9ACTN|nr:response regulator transcription factor [Nocardioides acrostichi]MBF4160257.1 response regulator transcription factor [Nocardioides acrostichi]